MQERYIDEEVGVFAVSSVCVNGKVDVREVHRNTDVFRGIDIELAERICEAQERFRRELYELLEDVRYY